MHVSRAYLTKRVTKIVDLIYCLHFGLASHSIGDKYNMIVVAEPADKMDSTTCKCQIFAYRLFVDFKYSRMDSNHVHAGTEASESYANERAFHDRAAKYGNLHFLTKPISPTQLPLVDPVCRLAYLSVSSCSAYSFFWQISY